MMTLRRSGAAALPALKLLAASAAGAAIMRYAFQQAEAGGQGTLWLAAAAIVPIFIGIFGWMVRDSGNLRELTGRFNDHKEQSSRKVEKIDDAQERMFRELGSAAEFRLQVMQRLDQLDQDRGVQSKLRHDLRNEFTAVIGAVELKLSERDDKQDERLRAVERAVDRGAA